MGGGHTFKESEMKRLKTTTVIIGSIHVLAVIIFVLGTLFCYYYPREIAVYNDSVDKMFAPLEWSFIWLIGAALWAWFYIVFSCCTLSSE